MKSYLAKFFIILAFANIIVGLSVLLTHKFTIVPLIEWIETIPKNDREILISFFSKSQIAFGLVCLVLGAAFGFRPKSSK
jgi:hypothetical protein